MGLRKPLGFKKKVEDSPKTFPNTEEFERVRGFEFRFWNNQKVDLGDVGLGFCELAYRDKRMLEIKKTNKKKFLSIVISNKCKKICDAIAEEFGLD